MGSPTRINYCLAQRLALTYPQMNTKQFKFKTREEWLIAATDLMRPLFKRAGKPIPDAVQVSTGWPSRGATSKKKRTIGECWDAICADDKRPHVFISPVLDNNEKNLQGVLPTLLHELIHASVGCKCGHKGAFKSTAKTLGLEGKMTCTTAGPELLATLTAMNDGLGEYPHGPLHSPEKRRTKRDECRMIKCECDGCGYNVRTTKKWLEGSGAPICPCNKKSMSYTLPDNESEGEE